MGETCNCIEPNTGMSIGDYINIVSIFVNSGIAFWIVYTIQNKLNNKRVLKDFFIDEIKELRNQYKTYLTDIVNGNIHPNNVISWHKLMSIKITDVMNDLETAYGLKKDLLKPYQIDLRSLITENPDFINQFKKDKLILSTTSINTIIKFQQDNNKIFSDLIVSINNK